MALLIAGCSARRPARGEVHSSCLQAICPAIWRHERPNSLSLLPPPPALGSAAQARDDTAAIAAVARSGGPRWMQAVEDADLHFPKVAETFSCAVGVRITEADTPRLYVLLRRSLVDAGLSTYPTKIKYQRVRPFMVDGGATCTPGDEAALRKDGSYPSGHSALGWAWALILVEAAPERAEAILARGRAFGQSRVACNVHWLSDTEEGRQRQQPKDKGCGSRSPRARTGPALSQASSCDPSRPPTDSGLDNGGL